MQLCNEILAEGSPADPILADNHDYRAEPERTELSDIPTALALHHLAALIDLAQKIESHVERYVQALRGRGVSWRDVGEALGTSRQAAWERFGRKPE